MSSSSPWTAIRRRWGIVAVCVLVAVAVGWVAVGRTIHPARRARHTTSQYAASAVLFAPKSKGAGLVSVGTLDSLLTLPGVAQEVARLLHEPNADSVTGSVSTSVDSTTGLLTITVTDPSASNAVRVANAYADGLIQYVHDRQTASLQTQRAMLSAKLKQTQRNMSRVSSQLARAGRASAGALRAEMANLRRQANTIAAQMQQLTSETNTSGHIVVVQPAVATPLGSGTGGSSTTNTLKRRLWLPLAALLGLVLGVGLALIMARMDTRIYTKADAERAFGLPVIAQIPPLHRKRAFGILPRKARVTERQSVDLARMSPTDGFRTLSAVVMATPEPARGGDRTQPRPVVAVGGPQQPPGGNGNGSTRDDLPRDGDRGSRTLLLTSAEPGEGKTLVAANLAATLASYGQRVTVMSCDQRNPSIYRLLGVPEDAGPEDRARAEDRSGSARGELGAQANGHPHETGVPGVRLLDGPVSAWQFGRDDGVRADVDGARQGADCVLIDMPPMLVAGDASRLLWNVDSVVIVARTGRTTARMAKRAVEVLDLVSAPVLGVVLNDAPEATLPRRFRGYQ